MRTLTVALVGAAVLALMGCSGGSAVAPSQNLSNFDNQVNIDPLTGQTTSVAGAFHFDLDIAAGTAKVSPIATRGGQAIGDLFFLNVDNFGVVAAPAPTNTFTNLDLINNTIDFNYQVSHAFPLAANPGGTASGGNRDDLGISGRVVFLVDAPATVDDATQANHVDDYTFAFGTSSVTCNPKAILNANGYYNPAGMLSGFHTATNGTNAWPCRALVDESLDPRTATVGGAAISNGGASTGNYATTNSWSTVAAWTGTSPTGYGVLNQGQTASNFITLNIAPGNTISLDAVVIATYTDPRGGANATEKRANRLPKGDPTLFAYKMPHGATDVESISIGNLSGTLGAAAASTITADVTAVDQDFAAVVGTAALTEIPNASNFSAMDIAAGELGAQTAITLAPTGTGTVEDPVVQAGITITNTDGVTGGVDNGAYVGIQITDAQDGATAGLQQGVTLDNSPVPVPVTAGQEQHPIVVQVAFVDIV